MELKNNLFLTFFIVFALVFTLNAEGEKRKVQQPSFVEKGGQINRNEHALLFYADGLLLPPVITLGYRYGIFYWWDVGMDIGGDYGTFQALIHTRMENFKTKKTEFFFWALQFKTGYKYNRVKFSDTFILDDESWIFQLDNSFGFRFGPNKKSVIWYSFMFYADRDMREPRRQTDYYIGPLILGYEIVLGENWNFFIETGMIYSINGTEVIKDNKLINMYDNDLFPFLKLGFAVRTGKRTAIIK